VAESWLRDFHELLSRAGIIDTREPKAACPRHRSKVAPSRRLYYAFQQSQPCAFCDERVEPHEAIAFE
jgi:hypothetical protein